MLAVNIATWRAIERAGEDHYEYDIFECERAVYHPPGTLSEFGVLACEGPGDFQRSDHLSANVTAYVMNGNGKTIAVYRGTLSPECANTEITD